jgi:hexulose-6-phosphate isomerase
VEHPLQTGISIWAFPGAWALERCFALTAESGFDGIELAYAADGPLTAATTAAETKAVLRAARAAGVEVLSLASGIFWSVNLIADDAAERASARQHLARMLEVASDLEVGAVLVVPGFVGPFEAGPPVVRDYEAAYNRAIETFQQMAPVAERLGVAIGVENVWNKFLSSALEMRAFLDAVGSPMVGCYFDVANCLRTGYPEQWIRVLGPRITRVHFKDFRVNVGTLDGFVDLLEGDVDFPAVLDALRAVGYDRPLVVEAFAREPYPDMLVRRAGADMARILADNAR